MSIVEKKANNEEKRLINLLYSTHTLLQGYKSNGTITVRHSYQFIRFTLHVSCAWCFFWSSIKMCASVAIHINVMFVIVVNAECTEITWNAVISVDFQDYDVLWHDKLHCIRVSCHWKWCWRVDNAAQMQISTQIVLWIWSRIARNLNFNRE